MTSDCVPYRVRAYPELLYAGYGLSYCVTPLTATPTATVRTKWSRRRKHSM